MEKITDLTARLAAPAIEKQGCTLWGVEYVREGGTWYLRVLLDKEGGVDILDCEAVSRTLSDLLDEADPIEGSYTLEVGSAGAERQLKRPEDFQRFLGSPVLVKLYRNQDGRKEFPGVLRDYDPDSGRVTITEGERELSFEKKDTALVRLRVEF
ncbi:MAG: ribosome maturation factor RimP [Oscillibacter sp.]|nr:ribosome maturation factor RimP [Oscillibacter sp.]